MSSFWSWFQGADEESEQQHEDDEAIDDDEVSRSSVDDEYDEEEEDADNDDDDEIDEYEYEESGEDEEDVAEESSDAGRKRKRSAAIGDKPKRQRRSVVFDDDDDDDDIDDRFEMPDELVQEPAVAQQNHVVPVFNHAQDYLDVEKVFGSTSNMWKIVFEYESSTKNGGPKRLQYLSFENAAKVYCPSFDTKHYSKDWIVRMRAQFFHICTEFYKTYFETKYFKKAKYANGPHRVTEYTQTYKGVADKRKFLRPVAVYAATVALNEVNIDIMHDMEKSHRDLFRYNLECMDICKDGVKMSKAAVSS